MNMKGRLEEIASSDGTAKDFGSCELLAAETLRPRRGFRAKSDSGAAKLKKPVTGQVANLGGVDAERAFGLLQETVEFGPILFVAEAFFDVTVYEPTSRLVPFGARELVRSERIPARRAERAH